MTARDAREHLPLITRETALVAEADTDQALVDGLHQLLVDQPCQVAADKAPGGG